jgi:hypothetical protein
VPGQLLDAGAEAIVATVDLTNSKITGKSEVLFSEVWSRDTFGALSP